MIPILPAIATPLLVFLDWSSVCHGHVGCIEHLFSEDHRQQQVTLSRFLTSVGLEQKEKWCQRWVGVRTGEMAAWGWASLREECRWPSGGASQPGCGKWGRAGGFKSSGSTQARLASSFLFSLLNTFFGVCTSREALERKKKKKKKGKYLSESAAFTHFRVSSCCRKKSHGN